VSKESIAQAAGRRRHGVKAFEDMKALMASLDEDIAKAEGGNKAAGTRVRQAMQELKTMAQEVRNQILEQRKAAEGG